MECRTCDRCHASVPEASFELHAVRCAVSNPACPYCSTVLIRSAGEGGGRSSRPSSAAAGSSSASGELDATVEAHAAHFRRLDTMSAAVSDPDGMDLLRSCHLHGCNFFSVCPGSCETLLHTAARAKQMESLNFLLFGDPDYGKDGTKWPGFVRWGSSRRATATAAGGGGGGGSSTIGGSSTGGGGGGGSSSSSSPPPCTSPGSPSVDTTLTLSSFLHLRNALHDTALDVAYKAGWTPGATLLQSDTMSDAVEAAAAAEAISRAASAERDAALAAAEEAAAAACDPDLSQRCPHCSSMIPAANFEIHSVRCERAAAQSPPPTVLKPIPCPWCKAWGGVSDSDEESEHKCGGGGGGGGGSSDNKTGAIGPGSAFFPSPFLFVGSDQAAVNAHVSSTRGDGKSLLAWIGAGDLASARAALRHGLDPASVVAYVCPVTGHNIMHAAVKASLDKVAGKTGSKTGSVVQWLLDEVEGSAALASKPSGFALLPDTPYQMAMKGQTGSDKSIALLLSRHMNMDKMDREVLMPTSPPKPSSSVMGNFGVLKGGSVMSRAGSTARLGPMSRAGSTTPPPPLMPLSTTPPPPLMPLSTTPPPPLLF